MRILLTILLCSIDSPFIFILFTIVNVLPRKMSIFSPSFMVSNSNSLLKACNCVIFTFVEPWYFCFMDSQIALEVPLSRIVSRISLSMDWNKKFLVFKSFNFASSTYLLTRLCCFDRYLRNPIFHQAPQFSASQKILHRHDQKS